MSKLCKCGDPVGHAKAVESAIMNCLFNARTDTNRGEHYWRKHADMLEQKFTTEHGRHYSRFLYNED